MSDPSSTKAASNPDSDGLEFFRQAENMNKFCSFVGTSIDHFKANFEKALKGKNPAAVINTVPPVVRTIKVAAAFPAVYQNSSEGELMKAGFLLEKKIKSTWSIS